MLLKFAQKINKVGYFFQITCENQCTRIKTLNVRLKLWQYWKYGRIIIPYVDNNFANVRLQEFIEKERKGENRLLRLRQTTKCVHSKGNSEQREEANKMKGNICKPYI